MFGSYADSGPDFKFIAAKEYACLKMLVPVADLLSDNRHSSVVLELFALRKENTNMPTGRKLPLNNSTGRGIFINTKSITYQDIRVITPGS